MKIAKTKSFFTKLSAGLLLAIPCIAASTAIAQTAAPAGNSTIHGHAIYADTERPIRRARVILILAENQSQPQSIVTDIRGEFTFKNLPAGVYQILVGSPGDFYGYPQRNKRKPTEVTVDGKSSTVVVVRAERGGAITGKISYPDGEPAVGAQINVFVKEGNRWSHAPIIPNTSQTDDRGIYRVYALQPGEYVVNVIEQSMIIEEREGGTMQTVGNKSLTPYYYDDASSLKSAKVIQVEAGRDVNNIDITLAERSTYKVAGIIVSRGKPLSGAYLRLRPHDNLGGPTLTIPHGTPARADKDGQWVFGDVPDGTYEVELDTTSEQFSEKSPGSANQIRRKFISRPLQVTVTGSDVSDLIISLSLAGRISGTVIVEGDKPLPQSLDISAGLLGSDRQYTASARVNSQSKGAFLIEGVTAGENILTVNLWRGEYFVKAMIWNSKDLLLQPLKVTEGGELKDVRIILSADVGRLLGRLVSSEDKKPVSNARLVLVPVDEVKRTRMDAFQFSYTDKQGAFKVIGPPGEYILLVQPSRDMQPSRENPISLFDYVRTQAPGGTRVTLKTGEPPIVDVVAPGP